MTLIFKIVTIVCLSLYIISFIIGLYTLEKDMWFTSKYGTISDINFKIFTYSGAIWLIFALIFCMYKICVLP